MVVVSEDSFRIIVAKKYITSACLVFLFDIAVFLVLDTRKISHGKGLNNAL